MNTSPPDVHLDNLRATKILGKGATGTVFLVHHNNNDHSSLDKQHHPFALKVVEKSSSSSSSRRARHEISVLRRLSATNHPFLPHLITSFETQDLICWGIPYCSGGDLNALRYAQNDRVFSPSVIRFYLAEIICAIEHLHEKGVVYRDLKPENILVQQTGHVTLTDFDLSRDLVRNISDAPNSYSEEQKSLKDRTNYSKFTRFVIPRKVQNSKKPLKKAKSARVLPVNRRNHDEFSTSQRSNSFVGTEEYVAPEVVTGDGHEFAVDWWALGVLCYEMLYGTTPFKGKNRKETYRNILLSEPEIFGKPNALSDLIKKLLVKDPTRRLGYRRGACEIKEHEFFKGLRWDLLTEVSRPPILPLKEETEVTEGVGINVKEYFRKMKVVTEPLWSPSTDESGDSVSLTEF